MKLINSWLSQPLSRFRYGFWLRSRPALRTVGSSGCSDGLRSMLSRRHICTENSTVDVTHSHPLASLALCRRRRCRSRRLPPSSVSGNGLMPPCHALDPQQIKQAEAGQAVSGGRRKLNIRTCMRRALAVIAVQYGPGWKLIFLCETGRKSTYTAT